jgi:hypothetical protein
MSKVLNEAVANGKILLVGEYMGVNATAREITSIKTGKLVPFKVATHIVLTGVGTHVRCLNAEEILPDDCDVTKYQSPAKRGDQVVVLVSQVKTERGVTSIRAEKNGIVLVDEIP